MANSNDLLRLPCRHSRLDFTQAFAHEENAVDQHPVRGTFDFKVAEQHIGTEQRQDLIDAVVGFAIGVDVDLGLTRLERREDVCGAACACAKG